MKRSVRDETLGSHGGLARFWPRCAANGNELIARGFGTAVPRFAQERHWPANSFQLQPGRRLPSRGVRCFPDSRECRCPRLFRDVGIRGDPLNLIAQSLKTSVIAPGIDERVGIKRSNDAAHFVQFQQSRALGDEKPDTQLNGRDVFD